MQNKPNLLNVKINVTSFTARDYENISLRRLRENKPNQTQFSKPSDHYDNEEHRRNNCNYPAKTDIFHLFPGKYKYQEIQAHIRQDSKIMIIAVAVYLLKQQKQKQHMKDYTRKNNGPAFKQAVSFYRREL